jgi:uncharacterized glyoxalase superfamily protein PhnB
MTISTSGQRQPSIWASVVSNDARALLEWLLATPCRPGTSSLHVVTADPDAVMARARALAAVVVHELTDQTDYHSRDFTVADPDGNHWTFATFAG